MKKINKIVEGRDTEKRKNILQYKQLSRLEREAIEPPIELKKSGNRITLQRK